MVGRRPLCALPRVVVLHKVRQRRHGGVGEHSRAIFRAEVGGRADRRRWDLKAELRPGIMRPERGHGQRSGTDRHAGLLGEDLAGVRAEREQNTQDGRTRTGNDFEGMCEVDGVSAKDHFGLADMDEDGIIAGDGDLETFADQLPNIQT